MAKKQNCVSVIHFGTSVALEDWQYQEARAVKGGNKNEKRASIHLACFKHAVNHRI